MPAPLPIADVLGELVATLRDSASAVLVAPTGAGKTTRVPPALADAGYDRVVVLEPRRVAARAAAARIRDERGPDFAGHHVRFDRRVPRSARVEVVTEGLLVRRLQDDPFLDGVGAVVLDEFHERSVHADLALAMVRRVQLQVRPELRLVVMSATLDADAVATWLGCPVVRSHGRAHPVEVRYLSLEDPRPVPERVAAGIAAVWRETAGDVLAFLPGLRDLHATRALVDAPTELLYGNLPLDAQARVLRPARHRRVVLATNVAQTSVTLPGVTAVVDCGLAKVARYDPRRGLDRLQTERISIASADQRAGRAGRLGPGLCLRLWTERDHRTRAEADTAELHRVDLAGPALQLLEWGETDLEQFGWFEAPDPERLRAALGVLDDLGLRGALRTRAARLPLPPRVARMVLEGHALGHTIAVCTEAADITERPGARDRVARQLRDLLRGIPGGRPEGTAEEAIERAVLAGWPDRVARARGGDRRARLVGGRGVRVPGDGPLPELFVATDVDDTGFEGVVHHWRPIDRAWLATTDTTEVTWDVAGARVQGVRRTRYRDLVLVEHPAPADPEAAAEVLAAHVDDIAGALGLDDEPLAAWLARVRLAGRFEDLPSFDADHLRTLLLALCRGCRSVGDLRTAASTALPAMLTHRQRVAVDRLAPTHVTLPGGRKARLAYPPEGPPILAVRMQHLFGVRDTPTVGRGVPVLLHLLAPNGRPQQITQDLAGFWERTWPEVRKQLRGRYPKHAWPEDPLAPADR